MIKPEEFNQLDNIDVVEKIYDELLLNEINAIPSKDKKIQQKYFAKLCHDLIQQYLKWNDYVHSNNIMQLFKSVALKDETTKKPSWFIRYEILIYGKRTPLYFIIHPETLFDKIISICLTKKEIQIEKLKSAIESLLNFYKNKFLSEYSNPIDQEVFINKFNEIFIEYYEELEKDDIPEVIIEIIDTFIEYVENPEIYINPGILKDDFEMWEEDDDCIVIEVKDPPVGVIKPEKEEIIIKNNIDPVLNFSSKDELRNLKGKVIRFIGALNKSSIKSKLIGMSKRYGFELELFTDYDKFTNMDFSKMRYSNRIDGIIAGPMPHSIKGMGSYSSGLEMLKNEPGYPPVAECIACDKLKVTATSLWLALKELDSEFGSC